MATFKAVINNKPKQDGTYTIMLRITENRKVNYISISEFVKKSDWNPIGNNGKYVRQSHPRHAFINSLIEEKIKEAKEKAGKIKIKTSAAIKAALKGDRESFLDFTQKHIDNIKQNPKSYNRWKKYKTVLKKLKEGYLVNKDLTFEEIDYEFLKSYKAYLYSIGNATNTVNSDLKYIRAILYEAIRAGKFPQGKNPFFTFKLEKEKSYKVALTNDELQKIGKLELNPNLLEWHIRNFFMFSFYTHGMRVGDFITLKWKNIQEGRLIYQMDKTGEVVSILLNEKSLNILSFYRPKKNNQEHYIFPLLSNDKDYSDNDYLLKQMSSKNALINKYLKIIAAKAEINKNLHFHIARHTFASIARDKIQDISKIQRLMSHSSIAITQNYLGSISNKSLDADSNKIYE